MLLLRILLFPLFPILYLVIKIRNLLYDLDFIAISHTPVKSICVGNLKVGGTGKTPFTNMIISQLSHKDKVVLLSRGYGRKTSGFIEATANMTAEEIGDEAKMISLYHDQIIVCVCEDRVYGAEKILSLHPSIEFMILDDALQHRSIKSTKDILLTEYDHPYFRDFLFPLGSLRDLRSSSKRANIIVITKSPENLTVFQMDQFVNKMNPESYQKVYFSTIEYSPLRPMIKQKGALSIKKGEAIVTVAGIASSLAFEKELSRQYAIQKRFRFKDHHSYKISELESIGNWAREKNAMIVTTAKDAAKWIELTGISENFRSRVYIQDIAYKVIDYRGANIHSMMADVTN